jgi:dTMP kinase
VALLIDIEGIDGSGKGTQSRLLCERLGREGYAAELLSFPRYDATLFGRAIGEFLNGQFGGLADVHPFLVSLLFAGDRFESKQLLLDSLRTKDVVVLDRYVPSNVAHQASKVTGAERAELTRRILQIEFEIYGLPRPDLVLLLDLPTNVARELVAKKSARTYTARAADIQEADLAYMQNVHAVYQELARTEPGWRVIACCGATGLAAVPQLRSMEEIAEDVWQVVRGRIDDRRT